MPEVGFTERLGFGFGRLVSEGLLGLKPEDVHGAGYVRREPETVLSILSIQDVTMSELEPGHEYQHFALPNVQRSVIITNEGDSVEEFSRPTIIHPIGRPFGAPRLISGNGNIFQNYYNPELKGVAQIKETTHETPGGLEQGFYFKVADDAPLGSVAAVALSFAGVPFTLYANVVGAGQTLVSAEASRNVYPSEELTVTGFTMHFENPVDTRTESVLWSEITSLQDVQISGDAIFESANFVNVGTPPNLFRALAVEIKSSKVVLPGMSGTISWKWSLNKYNAVLVPFAVTFTVIGGEG